MLNLCRFHITKAGNECILVRRLEFFKIHHTSFLYIFFYYFANSTLFLELKDTVSHVGQRLIDTMKNTWNMVYHLAVNKSVDAAESVIHQEISQVNFLLFWLGILNSKSKVVAQYSVKLRFSLLGSPNERSTS